MRKYWISTNLKVPGFSASLVEQTLPDNLKLYFLLKECSKFEYFLFKKFRINMKASDKFHWLKLYLKEKVYGSQAA